MKNKHNAAKTHRLDTILYFIERNPISDRFFLKLTFLVFFVTLLWLGLSFNEGYIFETPTDGGTIIEGVVGIPRFVNPILAVTRADQDMTALVYGSLLRLSPDGALAPHVAESIELQPDGRTYHVTIRKDVVFHDGTPLTARDVAYTILLIQNPNLKSPLQGNWNDVLVEELGEYELNVVIAEPYAPFIENFTVGILPRHIWDELPIEQLPFSQHNTEPIGSGPFKITSVKRDSTGLINAYELSAFNEAIDPPRIDTFIVRFYQNETLLVSAFNSDSIMNSSYLPQESMREVANNGTQIIEEPLPRVFAIFLNQNRSTALRDPAVRRALSAAIDRQMLVDTVLDGFGVPSSSPVPPSKNEVESFSTSSATSSIMNPDEILEAGGWETGPQGNWQKTFDEEPITLSVTIATANTPSFEETANAIATAWREIGVLVSIEQFEQADLLQGVIRPRNFEALLFGNDLSRSVDLYPFWHSSQKDDPGLNVSQYTNIEVDSLLETARSSTDQAERTEALQGIRTILSKEVPAIFLYVPTFTYVVNDHINVSEMRGITRPYERFANVSEWHVETGELWPIFYTEK